jgi:hypothetical protein
MTAEWDCKGCERHIVGVNYDAVPDDGLCGSCRIIGPVRSKAHQDYIDGIISQHAFRQIYLHAPPYTPPD